MRNEIAALHAKTKGYKYKRDSFRREMDRARALRVPGYVALSGGKDSAVVQSECPDLPAVWSDDKWFLPETEEYINRLRAKGVDVRQIQTNAWHADWFNFSGNEWNGIPEYAKAQGWGLVFLGLRQEESSKRKLHLRGNGPLFLAKSDGFWHCNPIWNWTWRDVWAYIVSESVDYNKAYDKLEAMGVPPERQRIGPFAVERVLGYGQLSLLKRGWPELYQRFAEEYPEARNYT